MAGVAIDEDRRRAAVRTVAAVVAGSTVVFAALALVPGYGSTATAVYGASTLAALALLLLRPVLGAQERAVWALFAGGAALLIVTHLGLLSAGRGSVPAVLGAVRSHESLAVLGLSGYPVLYAGQLVLLRRRVQRLLPSAWLDGVLTITMMAAIGSALLVPTLQQLTGLSVLAATALLGQPAMDLLMLAFAVANGSLAGWRTDRRLVLLAASFGLTVLCDAVSWARLTGLLAGPVVGVLLSLARLGALWLLTVAAWRRPGRTGRQVVEGWAVMLAPAVVLVVSIALLVINHRHPLPTAAVYLSLTAIAGVGVKVALVFREVLRLADSRRQAMTDELTGLPNRRALGRHLRRALDRDATGALLLLDLDRFKEVNDKLGHGSGDDLLHQVALRLRSVLGSDERQGARALLARLGGDEFAVVVSGADACAGQETAQWLLGVLARPFEVAGHELHVGASVGVATWPLRGGTHPGDDAPAAAPAPPAAEELLRRADAAMYTAKRTGSGAAVYDEAADRAQRDRSRLAEELRAGIGTGELIAHYQPQLDVRTGRVVGMEALVRWQHPRRGLLAPAAFLDLAEERGLMGEVTAAVLHQSAVQAAGWHQAGWSLRIAVNLATSCLLDPDLPLLVDDVLQVSGLDATALTLEITETTLMSDPGRSHETITELLGRGVSVSIDDYGTGYSSLAYLQDLPAVELKLDRSFTARLAGDRRTAAIIASTADLAHSLGLRLLVEGVEDEETLLRLATLGVDETQGFLHGRPMPPGDVLPWLRRHAPRPVAAAPGQNF